MTAFRLDIPPHVADVIRHLPPDVKRSIKAAMRGLASDPQASAPLLRELEGFWKYRVRRFRIVYTVDRARRLLRIHAVVHRRQIYEEMAEKLRRKK